eukprot:CAMPEP_0174985466 /NCGR_PEP_ID=MMETSP0004_2-20121128/18355_1 /TAXON_ID=420556 /ORGANISM="Ochromonas sp., Strain CCMP1393" /LENGTH=592 /DNA_ID=CAMNT_0016238113 /DNA_START=67 /DNA_END=1845 /DNA_ORIENTATION=+
MGSMMPLILIIALCLICHSLAESEQSLEDAIKGSLTLDFSIYNRDDELYINIINEDGYRICDGRISRRNIEQIKCTYDKDLLRYGDNTFFITVYSTKSNNIILQTTSHFFYDHSPTFVSKAIGFLKRKKKIIIGAVPVALVVAANAHHYLRSRDGAVAGRGRRGGENSNAKQIMRKPQPVVKKQPTRKPPPPKKKPPTTSYNSNSNNQNKPKPKPKPKSPKPSQGRGGSFFWGGSSSGGGGNHKKSKGSGGGGGIMLSGGLGGGRVKPQPRPQAAAPRAAPQQQKQQKQQQQKQKVQQSAGTSRKNPRFTRPQSTTSTGTGTGRFSLLHRSSRGRGTTKSGGFGAMKMSLSGKGVRIAGFLVGATVLTTDSGASFIPRRQVKAPVKRGLFGLRGLPTQQQQQQQSTAASSSVSASPSSSSSSMHHHHRQQQQTVVASLKSSSTTHSPAATTTGMPHPSLPALPDLPTLHVPSLPNVVQVQTHSSSSSSSSSSQQQQQQQQVVRRRRNAAAAPIESSSFLRALESRLKRRMAAAAEEMETPARRQLVTRVYTSCLFLATQAAFVILKKIGLNKGNSGALFIAEGFEYYLPFKH